MRTPALALLVVLCSAVEGWSQPAPPQPAVPEQQHPLSQAEPEAAEAAIQAPLAAAAPAPRPSTEQNGSQQPADQRESGKQKDGWDYANAASTVVVAALTLVLAVISGLQLVSQRDAVEHNKTIERAYVTLKHAPPGVFFDHNVLSDVTVPKGLMTVRVNFTLHNHGHTPAEVTGVLLQSVFTSDELPSTPEYEEDTNYRELRTVLVRDETADVQFLTAVEPSEVEELRGALRLYVFGFVDYIDRFGTRHRAGYGRRYDPHEDSREAHVDPDSLDHDPQRFRDRSNLTHYFTAGYNYDRTRKPGEGADW
jgi:hypothetical protein